MIEAISFDLDDTLFLQEQWLAGAWAAVAGRAAAQGVDATRMNDALCRIAAQGSAAGGIIDRALTEIGHSDIAVPPLVDAFRRHRAGRLEPGPGVVDGLATLRASVPIALISDGDVIVQEGKLADLGLAEVFDVVVWSDLLGREHRKPDPAPFLSALDRLGVEPARAVHVGDNPRKDVAGALAVGIRAVRVRTGEYARLEGHRPWLDVGDAAAAMMALDRDLGDRPARLDGRRTA